MIVLENVTKTLISRGQRRALLSRANARIPTDRRIAVVAASFEDSRALIELIAGIEVPTAGRVIRTGRVSFPVGFQGGFDLTLTVRVNVAHAARLYGADVKLVVDFVRTVADIGGKFEKPLNKLSARERLNVARIVAYSIPFDTYLHTTEIRRLSRERSNEKVTALLKARAQTCGIIAPSLNFDSAGEICDMGMILHNGNLFLFDDLDQASFACGELRRETGAPTSIL